MLSIYCNISYKFCPNPNPYKVAVSITTIKVTLIPDHGA